MKRTLIALFFLVAMTGVAVAKEKEPQERVLVWPSETQPVIRFTLSKFRAIGGYNGQRSFESDVKAENLWNKVIPSASFAVDFFGKDDARIGEGWMSVSRMGVGEIVKFKMNFSTIGEPVRFKIVPTNLPPELGAFGPQKKVLMTVYSSPSGAKLKVDGQDVGETPKQVSLAIGKHKLEFSKEGFSNGSFPLEIGQNDASGGTVNFELGSAAHDTLELRDGTTVTGDLESMSPTQVVVRVGGASQTIDRNSVKRILLVQREAPAAAQ